MRFGVQCDVVMLGVVRAVGIILPVGLARSIRCGVLCDVLTILGVEKICDVEVIYFDFKGMMHGIVVVLDLFSGTVRGAVVGEVISAVEEGFIVSI